jgi:hypothetical protein
MLRSRTYADNSIIQSSKCVRMYNSAAPFANLVVSYVFSVAFTKVTTAVKPPTTVHTGADSVTMMNKSLVVHRKFSCPRY